jgi:hypothetical protein
VLSLLQRNTGTMLGTTFDRAKPYGARLPSCKLHSTDSRFARNHNADPVRSGHLRLLVNVER